MAFTDAQSRAVKEVLDRHLSECLICRSRAWLLSGDVSFLPRFSTTNAVDLGTGQPSVNVICTTCGNTLFFNVFFLPGLSDMLGIKPLAKEDKKDG